MAKASRIIPRKLMHVGLGCVKPMSKASKEQALTALTSKFEFPKFQSILTRTRSKKHGASVSL